MTSRTNERRKKAAQRTVLNTEVVVTYTDDAGRVRTIPAKAVNQTESGLGLVVACALDVGSSIRIATPEKDALGATKAPREAFVRWCNRRNETEFLVGVVNADTCSWNRQDNSPHEFEEDLYEVLQLNMNADAETIQRVYRILAMRYHPDNAETGDEARFQKLVGAYHVLSDPERRAAFDVWHRQKHRRQWQIFESSNVTAGPAAEKRKRGGVLQALYTKRANDPDQPALNLRDMENLLGCPREHIEFALWYLREGGYISRTDNSKFQITVKGVDLAETLTGDQGSMRAPLQITSGNSGLKSVAR